MQIKVVWTENEKYVSKTNWIWTTKNNKDALWVLKSYKV